MCIVQVNPNTDEIGDVIREYTALKREMESMQDKLDEYASSIQEYMTGKDADTLLAGNAVITYKDVVSKRLDTTGLKKLLGDALDPYYKTIISKRFCCKV